MKIEEAIVYCLVTSKQVYAVACRYPDMFVKAEGRIMLIKSWGQLTCKVISKCGQGDSGDDAGTHIYGESQMFPS